MDKPKAKKARVTKKRDVRVHAELWHTSNCLLDAGQKESKGSAHQFRASLIFRAFSLEALLNFLGQHLIGHWKYLERLSPIEKLELLTDVIHVKPDYGSAPWQTVKELFIFRNALAHGKPETLSSETFEDLDDFLDGNLGEYLQTNWERLCTEKNAVRAQADLEKVATVLYENVNAMRKLAT
jgi:hypothetical protein